MFILTDGKNYVMENPMKVGFYLSTTAPMYAKEFTFKQARNLLNNKKKSLSWVHGYHMVNTETGKEETDIPQYSNKDVFVEERDIEESFDDGIISDVRSEVESILKLTAWDATQLNAYTSKLTQGLQFYDSAISDVIHVRMGKRPPAHLRTKVDGLLNELEEKRRDIKQAMKYIEVLSNSNKECWTLGKTKEALRKVKYVPYKGRTRYFDIASDLLKDY